MLFSKQNSIAIDKEIWFGKQNDTWNCTLKFD